MGAIRAPALLLDELRDWPGQVTQVAAVRMLQRELCNLAGCKDFAITLHSLECPGARKTCRVQEDGDKTLLIVLVAFRAKTESLRKEKRKVLISGVQMAYF